MAWDDRLLPAAYTSAQGERLTFAFEDVSRDLDHKGTAFNFADADGSYVQSKGVSGQRYPVRAFFTGPDHDLQADAFFRALGAQGEGILDHPRYGVVNVVPLGKIAQRDDLKTRANQTIIQVTFFSTIGVLYPTAQTSPSSQVLTAVTEYNLSAAEELAQVLTLATASQRTNFRNGYLALLGNTVAVLQGVADAQDDVSQQFNAVRDSIAAGIDLLVSTPATLAAQTLILVQTPALANLNISARTSAYTDLLSSLVATVGSPDGTANPENLFRTEDLYSGGYVSGNIVSVVNNDFQTKTDAVAAAEVVLAQFATATVWKDDNLQALDTIDTGAAYQQLQEAVALCAGFLIELSFSLKQERSVVLGRDRTIVDLAAELYGEVDGQLDFLINTNDLSGDEHIEIKRGREIVYYV